MDARSSYFGQLLISFGNILKILLPLSLGIALLLFFWGVARFILAKGDDKAVKEGKNRMIWGVITLFVMLSVWGLVSLLGQIFAVNTNVGGGFNNMGVNNALIPDEPPPFFPED